MAAESIPDQAWNLEKARHLLFRAGFGGKWDEIEQVLKQGPFATVNRLLSGPTRPFPVPSWLQEDRQVDPRELRTLSKEELQEYQKQSRQHLRELQIGWVRFMISSPSPADMLHEKMSFFWHGHFATSIQKVQATPFIYDQLKLFHDHALGNFGDFLHAIIRDPAMLRYLDNNQNRKGKPNENLAREIMELFSLGPGHYTEKDIQEGARALTGWSLEPWQFRFHKGQHDFGEKTILGKRGKLDGDDFVNSILEQPACSVFIAGKLWTYFAGENAKDSTIQELAAAFRKSKYDIKVLLETLFLHPEFYSQQIMGTQIKNPIQLVVGTSRTLGLSVNALEFYGRMLLTMGQVPYLPPNVKGWPGGRAWIDTSRLVSRYTFANIIGSGKIPSEIDPRMQGDMEHAEMIKEPEGKLTKEQRRTMMPRNLKTGFDVKQLIKDNNAPDQIVDHLAHLLLAVTPTENERQALINNFKKNLTTQSNHLAVQRLVGDIMTLPAYQLC